MFFCDEQIVTMRSEHLWWFDQCNLIQSSRFVFAFRNAFDRISNSLRILHLDKTSSILLTIIIHICFRHIFLTQIIETIVFVTVINISMIYRNDIAEAMNEIKIFHDCKWIESCETTWKILSLFLDEIKSTVNRLQMHAQNAQRVLFNFNDCVIKNQLQKNELFRQITLIEYFKMNVLIKHCKKIDESFFYEYNDVNKYFKKYFYQDISTHWIWHKFFKIWKLRKINKCVDRMYFIDVKIMKYSICDCCLLIEWIVSFSKIQKQCSFKWKMRKKIKLSYDCSIFIKIFVAYLNWSTMTMNDTFSWQKQLNSIRQSCSEL